jgi:hypothetical protein
MSESGDPRVVRRGDGLERAQQPQTQQIAVFEAAPNDDCISGACLDVNQHFACTPLKS